MWLCRSVAIACRHGFVPSVASLYDITATVRVHAHTHVISGFLRGEKDVSGVPQDGLVRRSSRPLRES